MSLAIEQTYRDTDCKASLLLAVLPLTITLLFAFWYRVRENITPLSAWKGGGGFWCPRQVWIARSFRQFKIILSYHRTFPQIYLAVWWCGRILVMGSDVAMVTAIWRACLAEIWISCLFFTLNWIAMLGIKYFGHLEHYCFEKNAISIFFSRSVTSPMTSYRFRCKL